MRSRFLKPVIGGVILSVGLALFSHKPALAEEVIQPKPVAVAPSSSEGKQKVIELEYLRKQHTYYSYTLRVKYYTPEVRSIDSYIGFGFSLTPEQIDFIKQQDLDLKQRTVFSKGIKISLPGLSPGSTFILDITSFGRYEFNLKRQGSSAYVSPKTSVAVYSGSEKKPINIFSIPSDGKMDDIRDLDIAIELFSSSSGRTQLQFLLVPNPTKITSGTCNASAMRVIFDLSPDNPSGKFQTEQVTIQNQCNSGAVQ